MTIKTKKGVVITRGGKVSCECCDVGFILVCDPTAEGHVTWPGGSECHTSPSWCVVTNNSGDEIYNGCPALNFVKSSISVGTSIRVRYSAEGGEGPCPGGHNCNSATFKLYIKDSDAQVFLGNVNLNNGGSGASVDGGTFIVTAEHINALNL